MRAEDEEVAAALAEAQQAPRSLLANLKTGEWLDAQEFPPLRWFVDGVVPEGMTMLVGGPKIGKSWLSLGIALAVAAGGHALGAIPTGAARPVLLLALEDGDRRLQARSRELLHDGPIPSLLHYQTTVEPGMVVPTVEEWLATLEPDAEPLVVLDTLGKVMPLAAQGESPYQRDYRVAGRLKRVCDDRPGMALLVLHHDRKAHAEDFVEGVSGTNGIAGAADTVVVVTRARTEATGRLKVTGRDVPEDEYEVGIDGGAWSLAGGSLRAAADTARTSRETENLGDRSGEIVRFIAERGEPVRAAEVAEHVEGLTPADARQYLKRLHDAGKLRKPERGLYAPVLSVTSVTLSRPGEEQPSERDTRDGRDTRTCGVCSFPLPAVLADAGETTHPSCEGRSPR